jgi:glycosyltransferase involved in cell wall biosynthesis
MRVTHVSIIHRSDDNRILQKECRALAAAGYEVHLLVPGPGSKRVHGVRLHAVSERNGRPRARHQPARFLKAVVVAFRLRPSVYHLHDAHLIPLGLLLKLAGARVVYDVHENYAAHARTKLAGHPLRGRLKALMWNVLESMARASFDAFVCASPALAERFPPGKTELVGNFPRHRDFDLNGSTRPYRERPNTLVYSGAITEIRSFWETLRALELLPEGLDCRLRMVGGFRNQRVESAARALSVWDRVELLPWRSLPEVIPELLGARAGLALLYPLPNHMDAMRSNKLFEYMAAGIPVIAPDMPRWREIVLGSGCGLVVDPRDPAAIAGAIEHLLTHPEQAEEMGRRGRAAVAAEFNWDGDSERLLSFYRALLGDPAWNPVLEPVAAK